MLALGMGAILAAAVLVRGAVACVHSRAPIDLFLRIQASVRVREGLRHLPTVATQEHAVLFLGTSTTMQQIFPDVVDATLREAGVEATSYNFGIPLCPPSFVELFADRLAAERRPTARRLELAVVELVVGVGVKPQSDPFLDAQRRMQVMNRTQVASPAQLVRIARRDPAQGADLIESRMLGGYQATILKDVARVFLFDAPPIRPVLRREIDMFHAEERRTGRPSEEWSTSRRGGPLVPLAGDPTRAALFEAVAPAAWRKEQVRRQVATMLWDPPLDENEVESFYRALRRLGEQSRHLVVLRPPVHPEAWKAQRPGRLEAYRGFIDRARAAGAEIIDLSSGYFSDEDFYDATHLKFAAGERYSQLVATRLAEIARRGGAASP